MCGELSHSSDKIMGKEERRDKSLARNTQSFSMMYFCVYDSNKDG